MYCRSTTDIFGRKALTSGPLSISIFFGGGAIRTAGAFCLVGTFENENTKGTSSIPVRLPLSKLALHTRLLLFTGTESVFKAVSHFFQPLLVLQREAVKRDALAALLTRFMMATENDAGLHGGGKDKMIRGGDRKIKLKVRAVTLSTAEFTQKSKFSASLHFDSFSLGGKGCEATQFAIFPDDIIVATLLFHKL